MERLETSAMWKSLNNNNSSININNDNNNTPTVEEKPTSSTSTYKKTPSLTETIREHGRLALSDTKLDNKLFGDIALIVELYNLVVPLYQNFRSDDDEKVEIKIVRLEFEHFVKMLSDDVEGGLDGKNYFLEVLQTLLKIFINFEKIMPVRIFGNFVSAKIL